MCTLLAYILDFIKTTKIDHQNRLTSLPKILSSPKDLFTQIPIIFYHMMVFSHYNNFVRFFSQRRRFPELLVDDGSRMCIAMWKFSARRKEKQRRQEKLC